MKAFLQFGGAAMGRPSGPFETVEVKARETLLDWQRRGLSYTATGYGARIPSPYMVKWGGRWRRVYVACYGNAASHYIGKAGAWLATVDVQRESNK